MTTPTIHNLSDHDRFSIVNVVQEWCEAAAWYEPGYTPRQNIREAFKLIRQYHQLTLETSVGRDPHFPLDFALHSLNDDAYDMREVAALRPGPSALGLHQCQV